MVARSLTPWHAEALGTVVAVVLALALVRPPPTAMRWRGFTSDPRKPSSAACIFRSPWTGWTRPARNACNSTRSQEAR